MNSRGSSMVVGLTGQTGAGKSTVSVVFKNAGFAVIDADRIARFVQRSGSPCYMELKDFFSDEIIASDGSIDRAVLAQRVFSDKSCLEALNSICYPYICNEILRQIRKLTKMQNRIVLIDAPTLFESRTDDFCELIISVISKEQLRMQRIIKRDGITPEAAKMRMKSQLTQKFFIENSDFIIKNNADTDHLYDVANEVADKIWDYYHKIYNK